MKAELENINNIYLQIEDYVFPAPEYFTVERKGQHFINKLQEYQPLHSSTREKFHELAPFLSPEEIIEGYEQGCRLLQANLSGLMYHKFDRKYIPVMLKAINNEHGHTSHLFLRALVLYARDIRGDLLLPILKSLESKYVVTQEAALSAAYELKIIEALPIIQRLLQDSRLEIREMAENVLSDWDNTKPK